ncbi:hypothetical protein JL193_06740 [Polaribacter batillariae]|uniref:Competence protein n=1 Tax=Polaribacter batillariae TaxID=2808900 RepID=A0ABX7SXF7_9FLAO|nr:hypothetical protein [Polaribacter batillariae]QTD38945.1 hypothetical protein JL193_06740 [Polaribacter batillariae]
MSVFKSLNNSSDNGFNQGKKYVDASYKYYKLKAFYALTFSLSIIVKLLIIGGFVATGILFASIALAIFLGNCLESIALGYLSVAGIYVLLGVLVFFFRKNINKMIISKIADKFSN